MVFDVEVDRAAAAASGSDSTTPPAPRWRPWRSPPARWGGAGRTSPAPAPGITGVHALYLAFHPDRGELGDVAFLGFTREPPQIA